MVCLPGMYHTSSRHRHLMGCVSHSPALALGCSLAPGCGGFAPQHPVRWPSLLRKQGGQRPLFMPKTDARHAMRPALMTTRTAMQWPEKDRGSWLPYKNMVLQYISGYVSCTPMGDGEVHDNESGAICPSVYRQGMPGGHSQSVRPLRLLSFTGASRSTLGCRALYAVDDYCCVASQ